MDIPGYAVFIVSLWVISTCCQNYVRCVTKRQYRVTFDPALLPNPHEQKPISSQYYSYHHGEIPKSSSSRELWGSGRLPGNVHRTYSHYQHKSETLGYFGHESLVLGNGSFASKANPRHVRQSSSPYSKNTGHHDRDIHSSASSGGTTGVIRSPISPFGGLDGSGGFQAMGQFGHSDARVQDTQRGYGTPWPAGNLAWPTNAVGGSWIPRSPLSVVGSGQYAGGSDGILGPLAGTNPEEMGGSSSHSKIHYDDQKANADASAHGNFGGSQAQTHVQGGASKDGSFEAKAQSGFEHGLVQSQIQGRNQKASSSSASQVSGVAQSLTQVQMEYSGNMSQALAQGSSPRGSFTSAVQGGGKKGQANSQAKGPGQTSSSVQMYLDDTGADNTAGTRTHNGQAVSATAQGGYLSGQSQTQLQGRQSLTASAQSSFGDAPDGSGSQTSIPTAIFLPNHTSNGAATVGTRTEPSAASGTPILTQQVGGQYQPPVFDPYFQTEPRRSFPFSDQQLATGATTPYVRMPDGQFVPANGQYQTPFSGLESQSPQRHPQETPQGYFPGYTPHSFSHGKHFPHVAAAKTHPGTPESPDIPHLSGVHYGQPQLTDSQTGSFPQTPSQIQHATQFSSNGLQSSSYNHRWGKKPKVFSGKVPSRYPHGIGSEGVGSSSITDITAQGPSFPLPAHDIRNLDSSHIFNLTAQKTGYPSIHNTKPTLPLHSPGQTLSYPTPYKNTNSLDLSSISKLTASQKAQSLPTLPIKLPHPSSFSQKTSEWPGHQSLTHHTKIQNFTSSSKLALHVAHDNQIQHESHGIPALPNSVLPKTYTRPANAIGPDNLMGLKPQNANEHTFPSLNGYQIPQGSKLFPKLDPEKIPTIFSYQNQMHSNTHNKLKPGYDPPYSAPIVPFQPQPYSHPKSPEILNLSKDGKSKFPYLPYLTNYNMHRPGHIQDKSSQPTKPVPLSSLSEPQRTVPYYLQNIKPISMHGEAGKTVNFKSSPKTLQNKLDPTAFGTSKASLQSKSTSWKTNNHGHLAGIQLPGEITKVQSTDTDSQYQTSKPNISDYVQRLKQGLGHRKSLHKTPTSFSKLAPFTGSAPSPLQFKHPQDSRRVNTHNGLSTHSTTVPLKQTKDEKKSQTPCNRSPRASCSIVYKGKRKFKVCQIIPANCS